MAYFGRVRLLLLSGAPKLNLPVQSPRLLPWPRNTLQVGNRGFRSSHMLYKKKDKAKKQPDAGPASPSGPPPSSEDPYDLSKLQDGISTALSQLKDDLAKNRVGGRFNTESIESLRVKPHKGSKDSVKLGELAQVVPKGGRMVTVLASEEDHVKAIASTIVSSNLSLTPQPDAHNALQLNIPIPPPTKESRDHAIGLAKAAMEKANSSIRDSRGALHKRLQDMQKKKLARPDDVRKAHEHMEKLIEKSHKDVKDLFETARKALERV